MLDSFLAVILNSHFEAYIGGPIAGIVATCLFGGFGGVEATGHTGMPSPTPLNINEFRVKFFVNVGERREDGSAFFLAVLPGLIFALAFVAFLPAITDALRFLSMSILTFGLTSALLGAVRGWIRSFQWWLMAVFPCMVGAVCFVLIGMASEAIDSRVTQYARQSFYANADQLSHLGRAAVTSLRQSSQRIGTGCSLFSRGWALSAGARPLRYCV